MALRNSLSAARSAASGCSDGMEKKAMSSLDSFKCRKTLEVGGKTYEYYCLPAAEKNGCGDLAAAVLDEGPAREPVAPRGRPHRHQGRHPAVAQWLKTQDLGARDRLPPARVLMQDFTGVPAVVDLAAMRDAMKALGGDPSRINPLVPVDLVIDHSVHRRISSAPPTAFKKNVANEYERNQERYEFLKWGPARSRISASFRQAPASATR